VVVMTMHFCGSCAHTSENGVSCTAHAIQWNFVGYWGGDVRAHQTHDLTTFDSVPH
jgi:hypothetical protein